MDALAAARVRVEIPRVNPAGARLDLGHLDQLGVTALLAVHLRRASNRIRPLEHAGTDTRGILDQRADFTVPIRFHEAIINLALHCEARELGDLDLFVNERLRHFLAAERLHQRLRQARNRRRLERPGSIICRQQHVGHASGCSIHIGSGDVEEHDRASRAIGLVAPASRGPAFSRGCSGRDKTPVCVIDALIVFLVLDPLRLDARRNPAADCFLALCQQGQQESLTAGFLQLCALGVSVIFGFNHVQIPISASSGPFHCCTIGAASSSLVSFSATMLR